jgi:hypothetical protein
MLPLPSRRIIMTKLNKLVKVGESLNVYRYDNGFMVEVSGRDSGADYKTAKILCATDEEMVEVIKEWTSMEMDD